MAPQVPKDNWSETTNGVRSYPLVQRGLRTSFEAVQLMESPGGLFSDPEK